jgi:PKD repeat protein
MFSWYFDDDLGAGSWLNGTGLWNVTHTFEKAGGYSVRVNVTDTEGNYNGYTKSVTIVSGPRPNVIIDDVTFDPEIFTEDSTGYIVVNLTNRGSAIATDVVLKFYIANADGTEDLLGEWTTILNGTTEATVTSIEVGGSAIVRFPYSFSDPGSYTVRVNVTSSDQLLVDEDVGDVEVKEAGWKKVALWGGVAGVIVLVPLLLYMRGRLAKREKRGPRREKARKEREKEKEKAKDDNS